MEDRYRSTVQPGRPAQGRTKELHSRTGLFMMELILAILFFSIGAACCLQVFARASNVSREAKQLKQAVNTAENLVQLLKAGKLEILNEEAFFYYNREGSACSRSEADYQAYVSVEEGELLTSVVIDCTRLDGQEIYRLSTAFVPEVYYEKEE